jgi:hypothetical protein
MITPDTPYKLAEIIRDTWPGRYLRPFVRKPQQTKGKSIQKVPEVFQ